MQFSRWYPLEEAAERAPAEPGMYQIRIGEGLLRYPGGRSAMVHYGHAEDVRAALERIAAQRAGAGYLCRHLCPGDGASPVADISQLSRRFCRRFGTEPCWPERLRSGR